MKFALQKWTRLKCYQGPEVSAVSYKLGKCVGWKSVKDIVYFANFPLTEQEHESKRKKTMTFVVVVALKGPLGMS